MEALVVPSLVYLVVALVVPAAEDGEKQPEHLHVALSGAAQHDGLHAMRRASSHLLRPMQEHY